MGPKDIIFSKSGSASSLDIANPKNSDSLSMDRSNSNTNSNSHFIEFSHKFLNTTVKSPSPEDNVNSNNSNTLRIDDLNFSDRGKVIYFTNFFNYLKLNSVYKNSHISD